ncbi:TonB-dependent receptor [Hyphomonas beringensis]|nr:TonB-dependent receptor [Hyphomonas beringensis]
MKKRMYSRSAPGGSRHMVMKSLLLVAASVLAISSGAFAQSDGAEEDDQYVLNNIVITAQKREQNLLDVPISITAFTGDALEENGVGDLGDLQNLVPNFQVSDNVSVRTVYVRGVGGGGRTVAFDTRTGIYLDGVYIGQPMAADAVLVNLERVEVLRGPQGYLYGQNTVSGAVNLVTKAPSNELEAKVIGSYGNENETKLVSMLNVPIVDEKLLLRVGGSYHTRDGFMENVTLGTNPDDQEDFAGRAQLRYMPTSDLIIDFSADYAKQLSHKVNGEARSDTFNTGGTPNPPADKPFIVDDDYPEKDVNENWGLALTVGYEMSGATLTSTTGYRNAARKWDVDVDHGSAGFGFLNYVDNYETLSQEFRLNGDVGRLTYVAGLYYMNTKGENDRSITYAAQAPLLGIPAYSVINTNPSVDNSSFAIFTALDYALTDELTLNLGGRVNYETKELTFNQSSDLGPPITNIAVVSDYVRDFNETSFSPSIGLTWQPTPDTTVYTKYSRGVKSGGFNADYLNTSQLEGDLSLAKETVDSFEIGSKLARLDGRLTLSADVFYAKYSDYQVSQFRIAENVSPPSIELVLNNAGQVETYGPELELSWAPVDNLVIGLSGAWLHAEYSEFKDGGGIGVDYSGNQLEFAPELTAAATVDYTKPLSNGAEAFVRMNVAYHGDQYSDSSNEEQFHQDAYTLVNGKIGWTSPSGDWDVSLYAKNLFDEEYDLGTSPDAFTTLFGKYGDPRTYGVEVSWNY